MCLHTKKGTLLTFFHIHSLLVFHTDLQKNTIVTCTLIEQNHILTNMQDRLLQIMKLIQYPLSSCVLVFHCHHQWIYWRRVLPKSTLYGWLWGYGIWCYTIDSRYEAKFIYNKDQHANTCVSVWGCFPVGKIWSSHSSIKSRFDKPSQNRYPSTFSLLSHWVPPDRFRWKSSTIKYWSDKPLQSRSPSNFSEVPCWVLWHRFTYWIPSPRFRWKYGNLSFTLNPLTASKLDHFLFTLPEGLSETANEDNEEFHHHVWQKKESIASLMR